MDRRNLSGFTKHAPFMGSFKRLGWWMTQSFKTTTSCCVENLQGSSFQCTKTREILTGMPTFHHIPNPLLLVKKPFLLHSWVVESGLINCVQWLVWSVGCSSETPLTGKHFCKGLEAKLEIQFKIYQMQVLCFSCFLHDIFENCWQFFGRCVQTVDLVKGASSLSQALGAHQWCL